jgi:hypothetical protein
MFTQSFKARVMAFLAVLSLFCVVFPAQPVAAGINGQQLEILTSRRDSTGRLGYKAIQVRFAGTNSRGQLYTHVGKFNPAIYDKQFPGMWWKGRLLASIVVYDMTTTRRSTVQCYIDVPVRQVSNYTTIMFSGSSCWKR